MFILRLQSLKRLSLALGFYSSFLTPTRSNPSSVFIRLLPNSLARMGAPGLTLGADDPTSPLLALHGSGC